MGTNTGYSNGVYGNGRNQGPKTGEYGSYVVGPMNQRVWKAGAGKPKDVTVDNRNAAEKAAAKANAAQAAENALVTKSNAKIRAKNAAQEAKKKASKASLIRKNYKQVVSAGESRPEGRRARHKNFLEKQNA